MIITTDRLLLRRFTNDDLEHIYQLDNDPEVMRYNNGGISTPLDIIATEILPTMLPTDTEQPYLGFWAVEDLSDNMFIGWVSLRRDSTTSATIGYRFVKASWGQGFATEAMGRIVSMAFENTKLISIEATTYEDNLASIRVMEKLGMHFKEKFRYTEEKLKASDTTYTDSLEIWDGFDVRYVLYKESWQD